MHVITGLNVGGAETMLARLLECGHATPDIISEVVTLIPPGVVGQRVIATGTPVHSLGMRAGLPSPSAIVRLRGLARAIRPDLIMGWMHHGSIAATWAAAMTPGAPSLIWNVRHSLSGYRREKPLTRLLLRAGALLSDRPAAIVYNSRTARHQYRRFGYRPDADVVIPNGFDRRKFAPRDAARVKLRSLCDTAAPLLIGMVARNHPMKDVPNLLSAFARVHAHCPDAHLVIAGEGMDRPAPNAAALLARLSPGSWTLLGHRTDVADWLPGLDILTLPSAWGEGFPNIVGEAMASGVPCVATDVGDSAWAIGPAGRIVKPADAEALAAALIELIDMGDVGRRHLADAAVARIDEHFALDAVAQRYAALFRDHGPPSEPRAQRIIQLGTEAVR